MDSSAIADLEVAASQHSATTDDASTPVAATHNEKPQRPIPNSTFVDPAILSYSKPPSNPNITPALVSPVMIADGAVSSHLARHSSYTKLGGSSVSSINTGVNSKTSGRRDSSATAILTEPFDAMAINTDVSMVERDKRSKKAANRVKEVSSQTGPGIIDMKDVKNGPLKPSKKAGKGKGWRQTPLIEEIPQQNGQKKQRGRKAVAEDMGGWATEDATDIQDLGEFDFESNLSKFDKRRVFDDIRKDDQTTEDQRLVSFNRKARPGTNGGRNLHYTENVLDLPDVKDTWKSEAGETEDEILEEPYSSGRGSRRANSRRPLASRKGSVIPGHIDRTDSPRPMAGLSTTSPLEASILGVSASFRLMNNKPCQCVSPLQMLEVEQLCMTEFSLSEDMLTENAGRSISEIVFKVPGVRSVLFLIGNHKSGARALAAARHLRNRRFRVTVVVLGGEREELLLEVVRKQLAIYKKNQGYVDRWDEYQTKINSTSPPDLIVDALLGIHTAFDELRMDDQAVAFEMIRWVGRVNISGGVYAIDVPSGVSATSGQIAEIEGQFLAMACKGIIALGAPKTGLLNAICIEGGNTTWQILVVDIGISTAAWQKHGSRRKHGIEFGCDWFVPVKVVTTGV